MSSDKEGREVMVMEEWLDEVKRILAERCPTWGRFHSDCWLQAFEDGVSPSDAVIQELRDCQQ